MKIQIVFIALLAAFAQADFSSKVDEIKTTIGKEFDELKGAVTAAKDKFDACAKEPGKNYFICAKEFAEQKFKETFGREKRDVAGKVEEIKNAAIKEYEEIKAAITAAKAQLDACAKEPGKGYLSCAKELYASGILQKLEALKNEAEQKIKETFGRQKRDTGIGPIDTLLVLKYYVSQCVEKNPELNSFSCAVHMFGPDTSKWEEKAKAFGESAKQEAAKFYATAQEKFSDAKQWLSNLFGRNKRDISSTATDIKNAAIKEYEEIKAAVTAAKDKLDACSKEPGKNYFTCAKEFAEQKFKETFGREKRDVAGKVDEIKAAAIKEYEAVKAAITDVKNKFDACTKEAGKGYFACAKEFFDSGILPKLEALKAEAEQKLKQIMGRQKRASGNEIAWYPSAEEVAAAKQIKICLDMGKDKAECYAKVLGPNGDKFDPVKLETITKYEDVLRELRQFHAIWNQGGKNIRECLVELHKQQTATKQRAFVPQSVQDLTNLKTVVLDCMAAAKANDVSKCAVAIFGPEIAGSDKIALIQQLVNSQKVQDFARDAGQKLHEYLTSMSGAVAKVHEWAHSTYDSVMAYFG